METINLMEEVAPWFLPTFVFLFGACIGSFLNVCIFRMPNEESILWPPSHAADGRPLLWWENIPILAWIILRGRDRVTGEKYGFRYLLVEVLTAVLFLACWEIHEPDIAVIGMFFVSLLVVGTFVDLDHMILPDSVTIGGMVVGVLISCWVPQLHLDLEATDYLSDGVVSGLLAIISAFVGAGFVFWIGEIGEVIFRKPAMGLGDVKLVGCIGAFCGWQGAIFSMFGGAIIGCAFLIPIMLIQRLKGETEEAIAVSATATSSGGNEDSESKSDIGDDDDEEESVGFGLEVPFGPMLALGGLVYFLGADKWVDAYFEMVRQMIFG